MVFRDAWSLMQPVGSAVTQSIVPVDRYRLVEPLIILTNPNGEQCSGVFFSRSAPFNVNRNFI